MKENECLQYVLLEPLISRHVVLKKKKERKRSQCSVTAGNGVSAPVPRTFVWSLRRKKVNL